MEQLRNTTTFKTKIFNNQQYNQRIPTHTDIMDLMDFTMFPLDHSSVNPNLVSNDGGDIANDQEYISKSNLTADNKNIDAGSSFSSLSYNTNSNKQSIDSTSSFNSDDLLFSKQSMLNNAQFNNKINELFNNDVYYGNGLITPPDSDKNAYPSRDPTAGLDIGTTVSMGVSTSQILNFNNKSQDYSPFGDLDYFNFGPIDQINPYYAKPHLSSPLHSPGSAAFEEFQYLTSTGVKQTEQQKQPQQLLQQEDQLISPKQASPSSQYKTKGPSITKRTLSGSDTISKPPNINSNKKRSKTLSDLNILPTSSPPNSSGSPSPSDFNPSIKNLIDWIEVSPISNERYDKILELARGRTLDRTKVKKVLDSFRQRHILAKLNIINKKIGLDPKITPVDSNEKLPRMNIVEKPEGFKVTVSSSSGYDDLVGENESVPSGLRMLSILKDHVNYKSHDELVATFESMAKSTEPKTFTITSKRLGKSTRTLPNVKEEKIKRPLNQFMIYRTSMIRAANIFKIIELIKEDDINELIKMNQELKNNPDSSILDELVGAQPKLDHHLTAHVIALLWRTETPEVQEKFAKFAKLEKDIHSKVYPNYKFNPQKRNSTCK